LKVACRGSIVHDAWRKFGAHHFALFATYMASYETVIDEVMTIVTELIISLLSHPFTHQ
jgi:hypothetical protein